MRRRFVGLTALLLVCGTLFVGESEGGRRNCNRMRCPKRCIVPQTTCCAPRANSCVSTCPRCYASPRTRLMMQIFTKLWRRNLRITLAPCTDTNC